MAQAGEKVVGSFHRLRILNSQLNGLFPVHKPSGIRIIDFIDQVRMSIEFDCRVSLSRLCTQISCAPILRKHESGLVNVGLGRKAINLLNFKHGSVSARLCIELGKRAEWSFGVPRRQMLLGVPEDSIDLPSKPYDHVTPDQVNEVMMSLLGSRQQYKAPREPSDREIITERNRERSPRIEMVYKEGLPPKVVNFKSINGIDYSQWPVITVDMTTCGTFCRERFAHELGLRLNTFALMKSAFIYQFETISIEDALQPHDFEWHRINSTIGRTSARYSVLSRALEQLGKPIHKRFLNPW